MFGTVCCGHCVALHCVKHLSTEYLRCNFRRCFPSWGVPSTQSLDEAWHAMTASIDNGFVAISGYVLSSKANKNNSKSPLPPQPIFSASIINASPVQHSRNLCERSWASAKKQLKQNSTTRKTPQHDQHASLDHKQKLHSPANRERSKTLTLQLSLPILAADYSSGLCGDDLVLQH